VIDGAAAARFNVYLGQILGDFRRFCCDDGRCRQEGGSGGDFLQTKEDDNDPYESSQFSVVIANASGIFGLYSYREVFEFKEFWGIGSGRGFALGAMHAVWDKARRPVKWRWPASMRAANSTAAPPDRWTFTRSN
jgi:hypothetical protein